ncbi:LysE family translocator [Candidatus Thalassolituus haligoni]|uniref:LysE family translocator n=1 Tax=Candidatus Thalassolituus haligoni TaxID=3100113 RepID=UPI003512AE25|tara:strand:+ start:28269 stop:28892 length:624 start_codon:yes stop_codon:yes gene_type:complete
MIAVDTLITFTLTSVLLALAPGPDNLYVVARSAAHGWRSGVMITLGLCTGLFGHTALVVLGVASVLQALPLAMTALKLLGASYLLWLGWASLMAARRGGAAQAVNGQEGSLYWRGLAMNISNPKVFIFFLAFLPQFANPAAGSVSVQLVLLAGIFLLVSLVVFAAMALLADVLGGRWLQSAVGQRWLNGISGAVFIGLAIKLVMAQL